MPQSRHDPILSVYSLKPIETKNDMPFYPVETSEGTCLLGYWKHIKYIRVEDRQDYLSNIFCFCWMRELLLTLSFFLYLYPRHQKQMRH